MKIQISEGRFEGATDPRQIDDRVRLRTDVPDLELRRGDCGHICSVWLTAGILYYEVAFDTANLPGGTRALLQENQIEIDVREAKGE